MTQNRGTRKSIRERVSKFLAKGKFQLQRKFLTKAARECACCGSKSLHLVHVLTCDSTKQKYWVGIVCARLALESSK